MACNSLYKNNRIRSDNEAYLKELYTGSLSKMYEHMFVEDPPYLKVGENKYGVFQAGFKGMVLYTNFTETIRQMEGIKVEGYPSFYDLSPLRILSGTDVFSEGVEEFDEKAELNPKEPFHHYNPKFIKWAAKNLIPSSEMLILGHPAKTIYDSTFSRFFRLLALSYKHMHKELHASTEIEGYRKAMGLKEFEAFEYLGDRYLNLQQKGTAFDEVFVGKFNPSFGLGGLLSHSSFSPSLAMGFWCRRGIDDSKESCWNALKKILIEYDKEWYTSKMANL